VLPAEELAFVPVVAAAEAPLASARPAGLIEIALGRDAPIG
jgi:hypothetical protein